MVVDLAVEHDPARVVFVGHRLRAPGDVDDGQAAVAEAGLLAIDETVAVRASMGQATRHRSHGAGIPGGSGPSRANAPAMPHMSGVSSIHRQIPGGHGLDREVLGHARARGAAERRAKGGGICKDGQRVGKR